MNSYSGHNEALNPHPEQNQFFPIKNEKKHKHSDHNKLFPAPEKRARFERTADMLAKSGLLDITMKTADLIRSNQQAQNELIQLKAEIEQFTKSVLANPENQEKSRSNARGVFSANPLNMEEVPASPKVSVIKMVPSPMPGPS
eukprot:TRINITY_DN10761_c0_g1_i1.p1 TRINITY_DN10761_c0_g1~~TRINITY_DN10761_c0_g1_i1.p1  ORF type:complete len:143 (-),score=36.02 TRINITY_DN10761_c0_g1_i1:123-551(-)